MTRSSVPIELLVCHNLNAIQNLSVKRMPLSQSLESMFTRCIKYIKPLQTVA